MDASEPSLFSISITLDVDHYAFVEKPLAAGVVESRDELFATALDALARGIETSAREAAVEKGCFNAETARTHGYA